MQSLHQRDPDLGSTIIRKSGVLAPVLRRVLLISVLSVSDLSSLIRETSAAHFQLFSASIALALTMIAAVNLNNQS
jgi:hypothetical protein